jgi:hypothetical protein
VGIWVLEKEYCIWKEVFAISYFNVHVKPLTRDYDDLVVTGLNRQLPNCLRAYLISGG